jgi:hypothetical protein
MCRRISLLRKPATRVFKSKISSKPGVACIQIENFEPVRREPKRRIQKMTSPPA